MKFHVIMLQFNLTLTFYIGLRVRTTDQEAPVRSQVFNRLISYTKALFTHQKFSSCRKWCMQIFKQQYQIRNLNFRPLKFHFLPITPNWVFQKKGKTGRLLRKVKDTITLCVLCLCRKIYTLYQYNWKVIKWFRETAMILLVNLILFQYLELKGNEFKPNPKAYLCTHQIINAHLCYFFYVYCTFSLQNP